MSGAALVGDVALVVVDSRGDLLTQYSSGGINLLDRETGRSVERSVAGGQRTSGRSINPMLSCVSALPLDPGVLELLDPGVLELAALEHAARIGGDAARPTPIPAS